MTKHRPKQKLNQDVLDLDRMSKEQLITLILEQQGKQQENNNIGQYNLIKVNDFHIESSNETLDKCAKTINKLILEHGDFIKFQAAKNRLNNSANVGVG